MYEEKKSLKPRIKMKTSNYHNGYIWSGESESFFWDFRLKVLRTLKYILFRKKTKRFILHVYTNLAIF